MRTSQPFPYTRRIRKDPLSLPRSHMSCPACLPSRIIGRRQLFDGGGVSYLLVPWEFLSSFSQYLSERKPVASRFPQPCTMSHRSLLSEDLQISISANAGTPSVLVFQGHRLTYRPEYDTRTFPHGIHRRCRKLCRLH